MPRVLRISNKLLTLRDRIDVFDDSGTVIHSCLRASLLSSRTYVVVSGTTEVARIRRKLLSWTPTWRVEGNAGAFTIRTRLLSLRRIYEIAGGPFSGAQVRGNLWDVTFTIVSDETVVARASRRLISVRDTHAAEIVRDDDISELFSVICMIVVLLHNKLNRAADAEEEHRFSDRNDWPGAHA